MLYITLAVVKSNPDILDTSAIFGSLFPTIKITHVLILTRNGWATFWAIFSQTHLVTLF
jgi:hypothetical protein